MCYLAQSSGSVILQVTPQSLMGAGGTENNNKMNK